MHAPNIRGEEDCTIAWYRYIYIAVRQLGSSNHGDVQTQQVQDDGSLEAEILLAAPRASRCRIRSTLSAAALAEDRRVV
jgi:hypothetical protein